MGGPINPPDKTKAFRVSYLLPDDSAEYVDTVNADSYGDAESQCHANHANATIIKIELA